VTKLSASRLRKKAQWSKDGQTGISTVMPQTEAFLSDQPHQFQHHNGDKRQENHHFVFVLISCWI
jgi:hypothetical protein